MRGRYVENHYAGLSTAANLPVFYTPTPNVSYLATGAWYHTFSPTLVNETRLGFDRNNQSEPVGPQTFPGLDAFPNLFFNDLNLQVGPNPNYPQSGIDNVYQAIENLSWIHGAHTIKAGYQINDYIAGTHFSQRVRGDYEYTTFANYLLDVFPDYYLSRTLGNPEFSGNALAHYMFVQDTWRVSRKLTADIGLPLRAYRRFAGRQESGPGGRCQRSGLVNFGAPKASTWGGLSPRLGLAYSPDPNTVIRAGFGRASDVIYDNLPLNSPPPQYATAVTAVLETVPPTSWRTAASRPPSTRRAVR